jgi:hypothetical protein
MGRDILAPAEVDGFTAVMLQAVRKGFAEGLDDRFGVLGPCPEFGGDIYAHLHPLLF